MAKLDLKQLNTTGSLSILGSITATSVTASAFSGDGSGLTGVTSTTIDAFSGSYATTGSNSFVGDQHITGSLYVSNSGSFGRVEATSLLLSGSGGLSFLNEDWQTSIAINDKSYVTFGDYWTMATTDALGTPSGQDLILEFSRVGGSWVSNFVISAGDDTTNFVVEGSSSFGSSAIPNAVLEVVGDAKITGSLYVSNSGSFGRVESTTISASTSLTTQNIITATASIGHLTGSYINIQGPVYFKGGSGDLDGNGQIQTSDTNFMDAYLLGTGTLTQAERMIGDVDGDGRITWNDREIIRSQIGFSVANADYGNLIRISEASIGLFKTVAGHFGTYISGTLSIGEKTLVTGNTKAEIKGGLMVYSSSLYGVFQGGQASDGNVRVELNVSASSFTGNSITSVSGTFTSVDIGGSITSLGTGSFGRVESTTVSASTYYGDGSNLTGISAASSVWSDSGSYIATTNDVQITGSLYVSNSGSFGRVETSVISSSGYIEGSVRIGTPVDGLYTDGFFDTFTSTTTLSDALDEISEAFLDLAPAKAGLLTSQDLTRTNPSVFTGRISRGLESDLWYVGVGPGSSSAVLTSATTVDLDTPDTSTRFRAGKNSDISASLVGGVSASRAYGDASYSIIGARPLSQSAGSTDAIEITDLATYNTFWAKANARINDTITQTGSVKYKISADNSAGESNEFQLFYVGTSGDYPNASFVTSPYTSSVTPEYKYMSGMQYYGNGTVFIMNFIAQDLYSPVYYDTVGAEATLESSYFSNTNVGTGSTGPYYYDTLTVTQSRTLSSNTNTSFGAVGTYTARLLKAGKSDVTTNANLGILPINTYGVRSTTLLEYFADENKRWYGIGSGSWNPTASLSDGQLQVQNGRLIDGRNADYTSFSSETSSYYRPFTPTNGNVGGTIVVARTGFSGITNIVGEWNGGVEELEMAFTIASESGSSVYDLGRAAGDNSGIIYGIRNGSVSGNTITWSLPGGKSTSNSDPLVLNMRYSGSSASDYITQISVTFNAG